MAIEKEICPFCGNSNIKGRAICAKCGRNTKIQLKKDVSPLMFKTLLSYIRSLMTYYGNIPDRHGLKTAMDNAAHEAAANINRIDEIYEILKSRVSAFFDFDENNTPLMGIFNYYALQIIAAIAKSDGIITPEESEFLYLIIRDVKNKFHIRSLENQNIIKEIVVALLSGADKGLSSSSLFNEFIELKENAKEIPASVRQTLYQIGLATAYIDGDFHGSEKESIKVLRKILRVSPESARQSFYKIKGIVDKKYS